MTYDYDVDELWEYCADIKCFKLIEDKKNFGSSRDNCQALGASLASIHNELEQDFVTSLMRHSSSEEYWIGKIYFILLLYLIYMKFAQIEFELFRVNTNKRKLTTSIYE